MIEETATQKTEKAILDKLAELGGQMVQDDSLTFEGTKFVIPRSMTAGDAVDFLQRWIEQQEEITSFSRTFKYRPWDGAHAFQAALKRVTGMTGIGKATFSFFGKQPPQMVTINVGPNDTRQVPWGQIEIPMFKGVASLDQARDEELGPIFRLSINAPRKFNSHIEGLFKAIEQELKTNSIYKGRAIDGQNMPDFKDVSIVDPDKIVYSQQLRADLNALLWRFIENRSELSKQGIPFKRAVVLAGRYGTGKTETANITAKKAEENGITFIQVRPNKDDLGLAMQTARLYQPSVVFFEDIDVVADADHSNGMISRLLDIFDGMDAKHNDVMVVLTTNHVQKIHKGMMRPGRIDAVIEIGALDAEGVRQLAYNRLGAEDISPDVDWDAVYNAMDGYMPAFVNEALKRVVLYHNNGDTFTTKDFVAAAEGLRAQFELMEGASEGKKPDRIGEALIREVKTAVDQAKILDYDGDRVGEYGMKIDADLDQPKVS